MVFGGELTVSAFADFQASDDPAEQGKIMHSMLTNDSGLALMASDTPNRMAYVGMCADKFGVSWLVNGCRRGRNPVVWNSAGRYLKQSWTITQQ